MNYKYPVSIFCITYNHEKFIAQALDSFLMQKTNFDYEIIIGEDCSSDLTMSIIQKYAIDNNHIKIITSPQNVGAAENIKRTLKACSGNYIAMCEGDDYWTDPYKLQKQFDFLEANPDYMVCYHNAIIVDENDKTLSKSKLTANMQRDFSSDDLKKLNSWILALTMFFRNIINDFPYNNILAYDTTLTSFCGIYGKGKYLPQIQPAVYRLHQHGIHPNTTLKTLFAQIQTSAELCKYYRHIQKDNNTADHFHQRFLTLLESLIQKPPYSDNYERQEIIAETILTNFELFNKNSFKKLVTENIKNNIITNNLMLFKIKSIIKIILKRIRRF